MQKLQILSTNHLNNSARDPKMENRWLEFLNELIFPSEKTTKKLEKVNAKKWQNDCRILFLEFWEVSTAFLQHSDYGNSTVLSL